MKLFVDASSLVAIIAGEPERSAFVSELGAAAERLWSAMTCWETVAALRLSHHYTIEQARYDVEFTAATARLSLVGIDEAELTVALNAYQRFGRGTGHPARLNMGDCFAYACAKTNGASLLYKGDDFIHTDLA